MRNSYYTCISEPIAAYRHGALSSNAERFHDASPRSVARRQRDEVQGSLWGAVIARGQSERQKPDRRRFTPPSQVAANRCAGVGRRRGPKATSRLRRAGTYAKGTGTGLALNAGAGRPMPFAPNLTNEQRRKIEIRRGIGATEQTLCASFAKRQGCEGTRQNWARRRFCELRASGCMLTRA